MKTLAVVPGKCRACQRCVLYCSFSHNKTHAPSKARIYVVRRDVNGRVVNTPVICIQCGLCMNACPVPGAMRRNKAGAVVVDEEKCTGCGLCVMACPYGVIQIDAATGKAFKCDLCGGSPVCVEHCPFGALVYVELEKAAQLRRMSTATVVVRHE